MHAIENVEHRQKQLRNAYYKKLLLTYYLNISVQAAGKFIRLPNQIE